MNTDILRFYIDGMSCQACASRIEKVLQKQPAVLEASVNFAGGEAQVRIDPTQADAGAVAAWIAKIGFTPTLLEDGGIINPTDISHAPSWRLWMLLALCAPFLLMMALMPFGIALHVPTAIQFALAAAVQLWLAIPFYRGAIASIKGGLANMDVLVSLGTGLVFLYSAAMFLFGYQNRYPLYFDASVMVITFVSLGKYLEERSKHSALNSIGKLIAMAPAAVEKRTPSGWQAAPLDSVQTGDILRASHGGRIAADGVLTAGRLACNESHLTGEPIPQEKTVGSRVLAGAVVTDGSGEYRADSLGKNTLLGDMIVALAEAQGSKAPIARLADKAAAIFVPVVVSIALLTFVLTWFITANPVRALTHAAAVLVIACPCAMGLAAPAAIMAGMGQAVRRGVWYKNAAALEHAGRVSIAVLDKTGTLTLGRPQLHAVHTENGWEKDTILAIAAAVEAHTTHPLARAIIAAAPVSAYTATAVKTYAGQGTEADVDGIGRVRIGSPAFTGCTAPHRGGWQAASHVGIAINGEPAAILAIADPLKQDSQTAIARLHRMGIRTVILSGDRQEAVDYTAAQLDIGQAFGGLSPRAKAEYVLALQAQGETAAMLGDGINDTPALAAANVSFAMKNGAQAAEHTADALLMQHSVNQLADALAIARATLQNIKQNLFFAFIYNMLGIPLAACGLLSPAIAGAAMALSSLSVLGNALRLTKMRIR